MEIEAHEYEGRLAYVTIRNAGSINGGVMPMTEAYGDAPEHWLPYFTAASCDGAIAKARDLGGMVLTGLIDLPQPGRVAVLLDPRVPPSPSARARPTTEPVRPTGRAVGGQLSARFVNLSPAPRRRMRYTGNAGNIRKEG